MSHERERSDPRALDYTELTLPRQAISRMSRPLAPTPETSVTALAGVGPARAKSLARLGITTLRDALLFAPRRYEDRRTLVPLGRLRLGQAACCAGRIKSAGTGRSRRGIPYCEVLLEDGTGSLVVRWYRQPYLARAFRRGMRLLVAGRVSP